MFKRYALLVLGLALTSLIIGCGDDKVTQQEEHFRAVGIIIKQSGIIVLDYYGPDYRAGDSVAYLDTLRASIGLNPHWDMYFYNEDGEEIDPPLTPNEGGHQTLAASFTPGIAELWWHEGEEGGFEFHLRGLESGNCKAKFNVMHEGHADFTTLPIPVVIDTNVLHDAPIGVKLIDEETDSVLATAWLADSAYTIGGISVGANDSTDHIVSVFFDQNGTEFFPPVPPHSLVVESSDTMIVTIGGQEVDEPWAFKLYGHDTGQANIIVYIYHDGSVGKTFSPIAITVQ